MNKHSSRAMRGFVVVLAFFAIAGINSATVPSHPSGDEFVVNVTLADAQTTPRVARAADGTFAIVWAGRGGAGNSADSDGIVLRRYSAYGLPLGGEVLVNERTSGIQRSPALAMNQDGDIVVAWETVAKGSVSTVSARRFTANGAAAGEIQVAVGAGTPAVALSALGDFFVAWQGDGVSARLFDAESQARGPAMSVDAAGAEPSVAAVVDGFLVTWTGDGIRGQVFDVQGAPKGPAIVVAGPGSAPSAGAAADGSFVVAWQAPTAQGEGILARRFDAAGTALDEAFVVNARGAGDQLHPSVAVDAGGEFVVAWEGSDVDPYGVLAQRFDRAGRPRGAAAFANVSEGGDQAWPSVATDADGDFVVAWQSYGDRADYDVVARRFLGARSGASPDGLTPDSRGPGEPAVGGATSGNRNTSEVAVTASAGEPMVNFAAATQVVTEGNSGSTLVTVTAQLSQATTATVTVPYAVSGTAANPSDHNAAGGAIDIPPGATSGMTTFSVVGDMQVESNETVVFTMGTPTNAAPGTTTVHTVTISNDDVTPAVFISTPSPVSELSGTVTFEVTRTGTAAVSVDYATSDSSAVAGSDYVAKTGQVQWNAGETAAKTIVVSLINDAAIEPREYFSVTLSNPVGGTVAAGSTSVQIDDDDQHPAGVIGLGTFFMEVSEGIGTLRLPVYRFGGSQGTVTVDYRTQDRTPLSDYYAVSGSDYATQVGTLTWGHGDSAPKFVEIPIVNDSVGELPEQFLVYLSNPGGGALLRDEFTSNTQALLNIIDDDALPNGVGFSTEHYYISEDAGYIEISVSRTGSSQNAVSVNFATRDTDAIAGTHYTPTNGTLSWAAGETKPKTFRVNVTAGSIASQSKQFKVELSGATGGAVLFEPLAYVQISDDSSATPLLRATHSQSLAVDETSPTVTLWIDRVGSSAGFVSAQYTVYGTGSTEAGADFVAATGGLNWVSGDTSPKPVVISLLDDVLREGPESVYVTLSNVSGATQGGGGSVTIVDNEKAPDKVFFAMPSFGPDINESAGSIELLVNRVGSGEGALSVDYAIPSLTGGATATAGSDYVSASGTLQWANGDLAPKSIAVTILNDVLQEPAESFVVQLSGPAVDSFYTSSNKEVRIVDDDVLSAAFTASVYSVDEGAGAAVIAVTRTSTSGTATARYATGGGTATVGADYTATTGTLTWTEGGPATQTFEVPILEDGAAEVSETLNLTLSDFTGVNPGVPATATLTIVDNEPTSFSFVASTYTTGEAGGAATISVARYGAPLAGSVQYATSNGSATAGSDYTASSGTLAWSGDGPSTLTFSVPIIGDSLAEPTEVLNLALSAASGGGLGVAAATLSIRDDEPSTLAFETSSYSVGEGAGQVTITITRTGSAGPVTAQFATSNGTAVAGSDYTATSGPLTWADGDSSPRSFTIPINNDTAAESNETVNVALSGLSGATLGSPSSATVTIVDNDQPATLSFSASTYSHAEGSGGGYNTRTVVVTRTGSTAAAVSVNYATTASGSTATAGSSYDYLATSGTLSWAAGDGTAKSFTVSIRKDGQFENDESIRLVLSSPTGGAVLGSPSVASITIQDDDVPRDPGCGPYICP